MNDLDLARTRVPYERAELREETVAADPIAQLHTWIADAAAAGNAEPNAMCLSTSDENGRPAARMVLLRGLDDRGLRFFTSYFSRKARELDRNPYASALFHWPSLQRQVRVEGSVDRVADDESDDYFESRPRGHQLSAWASEQSEPVESRDVLDGRMRDYAERFEGEPVPRPHSWGGYLIVPQRIEFWQGRPNRMHDRLEFTRASGAWTLRRLQP